MLIARATFRNIGKEEKVPVWEKSECLSSFSDPFKIGVVSAEPGFSITDSS